MRRITIDAGVTMSYNEFCENEVRDSLAIKDLLISSLTIRII